MIKKNDETDRKTKSTVQSDLFLLPIKYSRTFVLTFQFAIFSSNKTINKCIYRRSLPVTASVTLAGFSFQVIVYMERKKSVSPRHFEPRRRSNANCASKPVAVSSGATIRSSSTAEILLGGVFRPDGGGWWKNNETSHTTRVGRSRALLRGSISPSLPAFPCSCSFLVYSVLYASFKKIIKKPKKFIGTSLKWGRRKTSSRPSGLHTRSTFPSRPRSQERTEISFAPPPPSFFLQPLHVVSSSSSSSTSPSSLHSIRLCLRYCTTIS